MLPNDLALCVRFARFCNEYGIPPADLAELIMLARKAFHAGERNANEGTNRSQAAEQKAGTRFEEKAIALGFTVEWPGLWPALKKDERWIELPN